jgi:hypothetical protein
MSGLLKKGPIFQFGVNFYFTVGLIFYVPVIFLLQMFEYTPWVLLSMETTPLQPTHLCGVISRSSKGDTSRARGKGGITTTSNPSPPHLPLADPRPNSQPVHPFKVINIIELLMRNINVNFLKVSPTLNPEVLLAHLQKGLSLSPSPPMPALGRFVDGLLRGLITLFSRRMEFLQQPSPPPSPTTRPLETMSYEEIISSDYGTLLLLSHSNLSLGADNMSDMEEEDLLLHVLALWRQHLPQHVPAAAGCMDSGGG